MVVRSPRIQTFNPGELPLVLLALAEHEPLKAYEFIAELERLFAPDYKPSPGGVYPALSALVAEGLMRVERDGRANRYELTDIGRVALERRRRQLTAVEQRNGVRLRDGSTLRAHLQQFVDRVLAASPGADAEAVAAVLEEAARDIERLGGDRDRA